MKTRKKLAMILGTSLLATCATSQATWMSYTDTTTWNTALGTYGIMLEPTIETFEPGPDPEQISNHTVATIPNSLSNILYTAQTGIDESKNDFEDDQLALQFDTTSVAPGNPGDATTSSQFQFASSISPFAVDFFEINSSANSKLTINSIDYNLRTLFGQADSFFGILATAGETFSSLSFSADGSDNSVVDNARIGNIDDVSSVSIPIEVWLMGSAMMAMAGIGRREFKG